MSKTKYFTDRLCKSDKQLLHDNPDAFYARQNDKLTRIVFQDMDLLATLVIPVRAIEYHSDPYETWHKYNNWYDINQDQKDTVLDIFNAYYGACGIGVPNKRLCVWVRNNGRMYAESLPEFKEYGKSKDLIFDCSRAIYFYNNYDNPKKWSMNIPYNERIYKDSDVWMRDFVDTEYSDHKPVAYKMIYSKQDLLYNQINNYCHRIACRKIAEEKQRVMQDRKEIANAYAVLRKHGLLPENAMANMQKQRS